MITYYSYTFISGIELQIAIFANGKRETKMQPKKYCLAKTSILKLFFLNFYSQNIF